MKSKLPIGTKLLYLPYGQEPGRPCEIIGIAQSGRYAVKRGNRSTHVSDKTLASKEYRVVSTPPELWIVRAGGLAFADLHRPAAMEALEDIELHHEGITVVYVISNYGEHETWNRHEGTGKFVKLAT